MNIVINQESLRNEVKSLRGNFVSVAMYKPYANLLRAFKVAGMRYKNGLDYVHKEYPEMAELPEECRMTSPQLQSKVYDWRKNGTIKEEVVNELVAQMMGRSVVKVQKGDTTTIFGNSYNELTFMKALEKQGVIVAHEIEGIKTFFQTFHHKYTLDELINQYLEEKTNFIAG